MWVPAMARVVVRHYGVQEVLHPTTHSLTHIASFQGHTVPLVENYTEMLGIVNKFLNRNAREFRSNITKFCWQFLAFPRN